MGYTIRWQPLHFTDFSYNNVITTLPKVLRNSTELTQMPWGFIVGDNDTHENVAFGREEPYLFCWSKTNRLPYTKEAMKALILMVEFGVTEGLDHDDMSMAIYLEALNEVNEKHPLKSYELQRKYFTDLETRKQVSKN